jgi:uncharacterized protein
MELPALVQNVTRDVIVAQDAEIADSLWGRFRGLMLRSPASFGPGSGLLIDPCSSIHMFFMRFPIDVLYVDREDRVVRVQHRIKPWRVGPLHTKGARYVVELPAGTIERTGTQVGDSITTQFATRLQT